MMDNYNCLDVSKKARSICKTFCTGRVQFNGKGLVHQLSWPDSSIEGQSQDNIDSLIHDSNCIIDKKKKSLNVGRVLSHIQLPCNLENGGSITASEDGNSITFHSSPTVPSDYSALNDNDILGSKRRYDGNFHDPVNFIKSDCPRRSNGLLESDLDEYMINYTPRMVKSLTLDLSKLEQRIMSREGALGIALAVCFVSTVLPSHIDDQTNKCDRSLHNLLKRFDRVRSWKKSSMQSDQINQAPTATMTSSTSTDSIQRAIENDLSVRDINHTQHSKEMMTGESADLGIQVHEVPIKTDYGMLSIEHQVASDFQTVQLIWRTLMVQRDFAWPRMYEAAAAINRMRGTQF